MNLELIEKIKKRVMNKEFFISYEDAIELADNIDVTYIWIQSIGEEAVLQYITLGKYSEVKLRIMD